MRSVNGGELEGDAKTDAPGSARAGAGALSADPGPAAVFSRAAPGPSVQCEASSGVATLPTPSSARCIGSRASATVCTVFRSLCGGSANASLHGAIALVITNAVHTASTHRAVRRKLLPDRLSIYSACPVLTSEVRCAFYYAYRRSRSACCPRHTSYRRGAVLP